MLSYKFWLSLFLSLSLGSIALPWLAGQEESEPPLPSLEKMIEFSSEFGFPIFAIASGDQCPACERLKKTIDSDPEIKQILSQTLRVHLDVQSPEYQAWIRRHPTSGNAIPQVFLVRADSRELLNHVGSMESAELRKALQSSLAKSGRPISEKDAETVLALSSRLDEMLHAGKSVEAAELTRESADTLRLAINSYASGPVKLREILNGIQSAIETRILEQQKILGNWDDLSTEDKSNQIAVTNDLIERLDGIKGFSRLLGELKQKSRSIPEFQTSLTGEASPAR